jgi:hypothetical protein
MSNVALYESMLTHRCDTKRPGTPSGFNEPGTLTPVLVDVPCFRADIGSWRWTGDGYEKSFTTTVFFKKTADVKAGDTISELRDSQGTVLMKDEVIEFVRKPTDITGAVHHLEADIRGWKGSGVGEG